MMHCGAREHDMGWRIVSFLAYLFFLLSSPGNGHWDAIHWTKMWGRRGYLLATLCDTHWRSWGEMWDRSGIKKASIAVVNIPRHVPATVTTSSTPCHTSQKPSVRSNGCVTPALRPSQLNDHRATDQTFLSYSKDLWRPSAKRRAPDWMRWRSGRSLEADGC
jgi:hypothetical protein